MTTSIAGENYSRHVLSDRLGMYLGLSLRWRKFPLVSLRLAPCIERNLRLSATPGKPEMPARRCVVQSYPSWRCHHAMHRAMNAHDASPCGVVRIDLPGKRRPDRSRPVRRWSRLLHGSAALSPSPPSWSDRLRRGPPHTRPSARRQARVRLRHKTSCARREKVAGAAAVARRPLDNLTFHAAVGRRCTCGGIR